MISRRMRLQVQSRLPTEGKWSQLIRQPKALLMVVGLTTEVTLVFYTAIVYMQKYLINSGGISNQDATLITFVTLLFFVQKYRAIWLAKLHCRKNRTP